jgi:hypothetical protein
VSVGRPFARYNRSTLKKPWKFVEGRKTAVLPNKKPRLFPGAAITVVMLGLVPSICYVANDET